MQLNGASYTAVNRRITEGRAVLRGGRRNSHRSKRTHQASGNGR
jgi:hypothetical protein